LQDADVHVVSVRPGFEHLLVPSKIYAPLALGIPIAVIGPKVCEPARLVRRLGTGWIWSDAAEARDGVRSLLDGLSRGVCLSHPQISQREQNMVQWLTLLGERSHKQRR
jgi:hypothetical protein